MIQLIIKNVSSVERCNEIYQKVQPLKFGLDLGCWMENGTMIIEFNALDAEGELGIVNHCNKLGLMVQVVNKID